MGKGSLSIETMIVIVMCLFVLIISILYVTRMTAPVTNGTISTATLYSECNNWRLYGHSTDTNLIFTPDKFPALWQTYGADCIEREGGKPDGKLVLIMGSECTGPSITVPGSTTGISKIEDSAQKAKAFCTMEQK